MNYQQISIQKYKPQTLLKNLGAFAGIEKKNFSICKRNKDALTNSLVDKISDHWRPMKSHISNQVTQSFQFYHCNSIKVENWHSSATFNLRLKL